MRPLIKSTMKRINQIAKELGVNLSQLIVYLEKAGLPLNNPNLKLNEELEQVIISIHNGTFKDEDLNKLSEPKKNFEDLVLPDEFYLDNPFKNELEVLVSQNDPFTDRVISNKEFEGVKYQTIFTDFEAFTICSGIDNNYNARRISKEFFKNYKSKAIIEAHKIAMETLDKYGGPLLAFVIALPPLPFKALNATQIFNELDKKRKIDKTPFLRIAFKNEKNQTERIIISYYQEKYHDGGTIIHDDVINVSNKSTGQQLMKIARSGHIIVSSNAKNIFPILQVFISFSSDTKQMILNYGIETGECSICGRQLTTPTSIREGIGPICKKNMYY